MKKEYLVLAQKKFMEKEKRWANVKLALSDSLGTYRYYATEEEARNGLKKYLIQWNRKWNYGPDGTRVETDMCGTIGIDCVIRPEDDDAQRVVRWKIRVREVTDWSEVDSDG